jgi:hypothetical protein
MDGPKPDVNTKLAQKGAQSGENLRKVVAGGGIEPPTQGFSVIF